MVASDPEAYETARTGTAATLLPDRGLVAVTGPLRQKYLQGMLSNDVAGRRAGEGCRAALMDAKGHLRAFLRVLVAEDVVRLKVAGGRRDEVLRALEHYRVAALVKLAAEDDVVFALVGAE